MKKKYIKIFIIALILIASTACGIKKNDNEQAAGQEEQIVTGKENTGVDLDLTRLGSTMVYSQVYNMMYTPDDYLGKTIKMNGAFTSFQDEKTGNVYVGCIISDATACCAQGIEFEPVGNYSYPEDYPEIGEEITVTGVFEIYEEDGNMYCRLKDAVMES